MTHHDADTVIATLDADTDRQMQTARFDLGPDDTAWSPASTKHDIDGPGHLVYHRYPDGGIHATFVLGGGLLDADDGPAVNLDRWPWKAEESQADRERQDRQEQEYRDQRERERRAQDREDSR